MKNEKIHKGFNQSEIRDFLAQELRDGRINGGMASIGYIEEQIEKLQGFLKYAKNREATIQLIEDKNWEDWDVSEYVPYDRETYFDFIGTEEEYNKLVKTLKEENTK